MATASGRNLVRTLVGCGFSAVAIATLTLMPASASPRGSGSGSFTFTGALKGKLNVSSAQQCSAIAPQGGANGRVEITWYVASLGGSKGVKNGSYMLEINAPIGQTMLSNSALESNNVFVQIDDPKERLWQPISGEVTVGQGTHSGKVSAAVLSYAGTRTTKQYTTGPKTKVSGSWKCP